jgi:uncharacterized surface anchored protein/preprotein translocase subunit SecG
LDYDLIDMDIDGLFMSLSAPKSIPVIIESMTIVHNSTEVTPGNPITFNNEDTFYMHYHWAVFGNPEILAGDFSVLRLWQHGSLPISIPNPLSGSLRDNSGQVIGDMVLTNGSLRMTFNDKLYGLTAVRGTISIETKINYDQNTPPERDVDFFGEEFSYTFNFIRASTGGRSVGKGLQSTSYTRNATTNNIERIHWYIDVNTNLTDIAGGGRVTDLLTAAGGSYLGHSIVPGSIRVFALNIDLRNETQTGGTTVRGSALVTGVGAANGIKVEVAAGEQSLTVDFDDLDRKAYRITFDTAPHPGSEASSLHFHNIARLGDKGASPKDGDPSSPAQLQNIPVSQLAHQKTGTFGAATYTTGPYIDWKITANRFGTSGITGSLVINDTLEAGQEFRGAVADITVTRNRVSISGSTPSYTPVPHATGNSFLLGTDYNISLKDDGVGFIVTINNNRLTYNEGGVTRHYAFIVEFRSHITVDNTSGSWKNDVVINSVNVQGTVNRPSSGYSLAPYVTKTSTDAIDTTNKLIRWVVAVNPVVRTLSDVAIIDTFSSIGAGTSMKLATDADMPGDAAPVTVTLGGVELKRDLDYAVVTDGTTGFTLTLLNKPVTGERLIVTYYTKYELGTPNALGQYNDNALISFTNNVSVYKDFDPDQGPDQDDLIGTGSVTRYISADIYRNSAKEGAYDYPNGRFNWTIRFNHNALDVGTGSVTLTDRWTADGAEIPNQQQLLLSSLVVKYGEAVIGSAYISGGPYYSINQFTDGKGFIMTLHGIGSSPVTITYNTLRLGTASPSYTNTVKIADSPDLTATVSGISTTFVSKGTTLGSGNTINWAVVVNQAAYILENVRIVDNMGSGQTFDPSSLVIHRSDQHGTASGPALVGAPYTSGVSPPAGTHYTYSHSSDGGGGTIITIIFQSEHNFNSPHRISYTSKINEAITANANSSGTYTVNNSVTLTSNRINPATVGVSRTNNWTIMTGQAGGVKAPVTVEKLDVRTGVSLAGAVFRLTTGDGIHDLITEIITDNTGTAEVAELTMGTYRLYEDRAPRGYTLSNPNFITFTIDSSTARTITFENARIVIPPTPTPTPAPEEPEEPPPPPPPPPDDEDDEEDEDPPDYPLPPPPLAPDHPHDDPEPPEPEPTPRVPDDSQPGTTGGEPSPPRTMEEMFEAQTGNVFLDILNGNVPLGNFQGGVSWSVLNLMMSIVALFVAVILFITLFFKKRKKELDEDEEAQKAQISSDIQNSETLINIETQNSETQTGEDEDEDEEEIEPRNKLHRLLGLKIPALLAGIIPGILFLLLENIRLPITWITRWTPIIGAFFIIHIVLLLIFNFIKKRDKSDDDKDGEEHDTMEEPPVAAKPMA